jgi:hypothetical protein
MAAHTASACSGNRCRHCRPTLRTKALHTTALQARHIAAPTMQGSEHPGARGSSHLHTKFTKSIPGHVTRPGRSIQSQHKRQQHQPTTRHQASMITLVASGSKQQQQANHQHSCSGCCHPCCSNICISHIPMKDISNPYSNQGRRPGTHTKCARRAALHCNRERWQSPVLHRCAALWPSSNHRAALLPAQKRTVVLHTRCSRRTRCAATSCSRP